MDIIKLILTTLLSVVALFAVTKVMGHKQVSQLDFFDYVSGITIGSIGAELATELEEPYKPLIALVIYGIVSILLSLLSRRIQRARKYINGTPTILMNDGMIYRKNLSKARLDLSEFMLMCREAGYFDLREIQTAVFEPNGRLSILPRAENRPITPQDVNIEVNTTHIGVEVIMDGRIMNENLSRMGRDAGWLAKQLRAKGFNDAKPVLLAVYHPDTDSITMYKNEDRA